MGCVEGNQPHGQNGGAVGSTACELNTASNTFLRQAFGVTSIRPVAPALPLHRSAQTVCDKGVRAAHGAFGESLLDLLDFIRRKLVEAQLGGEACVDLRLVHEVALATSKQ